MTTTIAKRKLYFAHPIPTYGTERETAAIHELTKLFPNDEIINPAKLPGRDMQYFLKQVVNADLVVFMTKPNGVIGRGVFREVTFAQELKKLVIYFDATNVKLHYKFRLHIVNMEDWKNYATVEALD